MERELILSIFDSLPTGIGIYAMDGTLLLFNDSFCKLFGMDSIALKETPVNINDSPVVPLEVKRAVTQGKSIQIQFPYSFDKVHQSGYYDSSLTDLRYIKCDGKVIVDSSNLRSDYLIMVEDVTEAVRRDDKLRRSYHKTELAMQFADIMLWEFDVRQKLFYSDNDPLSDFDSSRPITTQMYLNSIHPDDVAESIENMRRMTTGENYSFTIECRFLISNDADWQQCAVSGSPYEFGPDGKVLKYVGIRKNNTEVHKKQQLLNKILDNIPLSIHIKDVEDDFRYVFCNEESKRMFGTSEDKKTSDVMEAKDVERLQKTDIEVFKTGEPYLGLERVILKDGRSYDTIVRKSIIEDNGRRLLLNTRWDQSLQNELKRQAKLFSITLQTMDAYTWFFEPDKNRLSIDEGYEKNRHKAAGLNTVEKFMACVHPDDRGIYLESLRVMLEKGSGIWDVEARVDFDGNGDYQWWEARGVVETAILNDAPYKYMFGMSINIDAHKQTELTLMKNKEEQKKLIRQNDLVLNNTNSGLAYITTDYVVQWENISFCSKSLSFEAYKRGEQCFRSAHGRTSPCEDCVLQRALKSRQTEQIKFLLDSNHTVEIFATPVFLDNGTMDGIVIRMDDVTEREHMIAELQEAKRQAELSDKLKSAFLANMSHEIRTPLNAIVGFSELMRHTDDEDEKEEYADIINNNNELLLKLINDILDLSKLEAGSVELKYEEFDFSDYFDTMAASMKQRVVNPNVSLKAVNPYPSCKVILDKNRVAQVLTNYVTNAIKYTAKGVIEMGYKQTEEGIYFYVKDSGIGIPEEKKNRVFHRFEKLDEFAQGTGLGLSICKAIAEAMGGSVGFDTVYGEGSTFWAALPCKIDVTFETHAHAQSLNDYTPQVPLNDILDCDTVRKTILVAEDIQSNFLLVSAMLKDKFEMIHAENGQQAVEMVRAGGIDLLFMDMKMPVMGGLTATTEIRKFNPKLPIVALTAHAFEADRLAALAVGCTEYLVKPIEKAQLVEVLRKFLK